MGEVLQGTMPSGVKVMVVDDDHLQRREITRCMEDLGIQTIEEADGEKAVMTISRLRPAVIIMDIKMPGKDGVTAVQSLPKHPDYEPKIILITGDPESLYRANKMGLDIHAVIEKPLPLRTLSRFVMAALDLS